MKSILIYSSGLDSTVLLHYLLNLRHDLKCISFNYGQKHVKEIESASYFCNKFNLEHQIIDLSCIKNLINNSCLTSDLSVPDGHYAEETMKSTVVPNRNMIMLSIAVGWAINEKFDSVAYAAHNGDHTIYPDCREEFVNHLSSAAELADWHPVKIIRPFVNISKTDVARLAKELSVEVEKTWSCYKGGKIHCGKCGTCTERVEALNLAGFYDKTIYEK